MLKPGLLSLCLLAALAGCSTASRRAGKAPVTDWSQVENSPPPLVLEHVTEGPQVAPPAANTPEPFKLHVSTNHEVWIPANRWARENSIGTLRETTLTPAPTSALTTGQCLCRFQVNGRMAHWNG